MNNYYDQPVKVRYITKKGAVTRYGNYALIERMRKTKRLICAFSAETGKVIALGSL